MYQGDIDKSRKLTMVWTVTEENRKGNQKLYCWRRVFRAGQMTEKKYAFDGDPKDDLCRDVVTIEGF